MSEHSARKLGPITPDADQRDLDDAVRGWANAADPDRKALDDAVKGWAAAVQHPANDEDAEALLPGPFSHPPAEAAGAVVASFGAATALSSAATKDPKDKPKPANPYLTPKLGGGDTQADPEPSDGGGSDMRVIPAPDRQEEREPDVPGIMKPVILSGAAALAASEASEAANTDVRPSPAATPAPQTPPPPQPQPEPPVPHAEDTYNQVVNDDGQSVSRRDYYADAAEPELDEDDDERSWLMKALPFAALGAVGVAFLSVMAIQGQGDLIVPETPKIYAPAVPAPADMIDARAALPAPINPVPAPEIIADPEPLPLTPEPEILPVPITNFETSTDTADETALAADPVVDAPDAAIGTTNDGAAETPPPPPGDEASDAPAIAPIVAEPEEQPAPISEPKPEPIVEAVIAPPPAEKPVQLAKVEPVPSPTPERAVRAPAPRTPDIALLPPPSLKPALRGAQPSFVERPRQPRIRALTQPSAPSSAATQIGSEGTVTDLLYRRASVSTTDTNFPDYWAGLGWMVGDTLGDAVDGEPRTLMVPDGRRFTLLPTGTRREMRTMTTLRAEEIGQLPDGLSTGRGIMRTLRDASLRAAPSEGSDGEVIDLISAGTPVQQIATLDQSAVSAWSLVGRYGIAFGFIKLSDLEKASLNGAPDSLYNRVHGPVRKDVVRVRTYCRDAVWEIGAEQGQLSACMAPDGKWLIEQQTAHGRDTVPAITDVVYE